jgi:hypothetical protein
MKAQNSSPFASIIAGKMIKKTVEQSDLVVLGTRDPKFGGGYKFTAIEFDDLQKQITSLIPVTSPVTAGVQSVTGLDTDNTDPLNPIVQISVDGTTITGDGTSGNTLIAAYQAPSVDGITITGDGSIGNPLVAASTGGAVLHTIYAFVDLINGNDSTATLGNEGLPFYTIAAAQAALVAFGVSTTQQGCVYLRSGEYTVSVTLKTNIITYCEPGVIFTSGGFIDDINTVKAIVLGYGEFIQNATLYTGLYATDVYIEAHSLIKTAGYGTRGISVIPSNGWSTVTVVLDKCILGTTAYDLILRGLTNFNFTCKTQVEFTYNICTVNANGTQSAIGKFVMTAPAWLFKTAGSTYLKYAIRLQGTALGFEWIMNGDIIFEAANSSALLIWALLGYDDTLTFNGNINLGAGNGGQALNSSNTKVIFNSPTFKGTTFLINVNQLLNVLFNKCRIIKQLGTVTPAFQVGNSAKLNMIGCQFLQEDVAAVNMINVSATATEVNLLRTDCVLTGLGGFLINSNAVTPSLGIKNSISNVAVSNVVLYKYATNNLEIEPLLTLPIY